MRTSQYSHVPTTDAIETNPSGPRPNLLDMLTSRRMLVEMLKPRRLLTLAISILFITVLYYISPEDWKVTSQRFDPSSPTHSSTSSTSTAVDWSRYAYVQYVTNTAYLCNSVMLFEILHRLGSKADRLMMYPGHLSTAEESSTTESRLLRKARDEYNVKLEPINIQHRDSNDPTWAESYTKLLAFNQTRYDRVLSLDSDSTVLQTMDELFLLPSCPVAMPRAYWLENPFFLSSQLVLIEPSSREFERIMAAIDNATNEYDMEIVNNLYGESALVLPHRRYNLITREFPAKTDGKPHKKYLGNDYEVWDPDAVLKEAKFLHFSDWPVPKPWLPVSEEARDQHFPRCDETATEIAEKTKCRSRELWLGFYDDFIKRRKHVCDIDVY